MPNTADAEADLLNEAREALIALKNVRDYLLKHSHRLPPMSSTGCEVRIEKLRAAIAKAEGRIA